MKRLLIIVILLAGCALPTFLSNGCNPSLHIYKRSQLLMGTIVEITVTASDEKKANEAITAAFNEIHRLENIMSTYKPESDISKVNTAAGLHPVKVHKDLILAVKKSLEFADISGGAFNIAIGPAIDLWNITESEVIPSPAELAAIKPLIDYKNVVVNEKEGTIFLRKKGMRINLGGIGKGFAADYAYNVLRMYGINSGVIAVAGDLRVFGKKPDGTRWNIGITHPRKKDTAIAKIHLTDLSISTSGDYERFFIKNGVRYHHILSPETLYPSRGFQSVSVLAKDSTTSDALSTAIFAMGPDAGMKLIEKLEGVEAVIVRDDGSIWMSSGLKENPDIKIELTP
ncbi:MAG: FAD:protein FMN transferase [Nitrospirota bacterium]